MFSLVLGIGRWYG